MIRSPIMNTISPFLFAAALIASLSLATAQDAGKPAPPAPPPAPAAVNSSANAGADASPTPATPAPEERHGEHHGEHQVEGWHHQSGSWQFPPKSTAYIGVITAPPPPVLTTQLGLNEGFGLVVSDVLPDSPAANAGIQRNDVLTKFNDQELVDSNQFSALVRALKKDTAANLTLIRKAVPQTVTVKIGERLLAERPRSFPVPGNYRTGGPVYSPGEFDKPGGPMLESSNRLQDEGASLRERVQIYSQKIRDYHERMKVWMKNRSGERPKLPEMPRTEAILPLPNPPSGDPGPPIAPEDILREARPGGVAQIRVVQPHATVTYNMANARLVMRDETGEIEMTTHDGKRSLVVRNAQGDTTFDGPIDTDEQRKALPVDVRKKLELVELQQKVAETLPPPSGEPVLNIDVQ